MLSQELDSHILERYPDNYTSYIAASYVKFLESSGSRVVPIWINQSAQYYEYIVNSVNGLLLPGGAARFNVTDGYATAGWELYKLAKLKNDAGVYFPVWGTCLGFELLAFLSANNTETRKVCSVKRIALPLTMKPGYRSSRLYTYDQDGVLDILQDESVLYHNHHWCITEQSLAESDAADQWHILSINQYNGIEFISSFEHNKYPFYGVQFHPEKNAFEWKVQSIPHSAESILVQQFFGNFFVNEARKNNNSFPSIEDETAALIYNYPVTYTGDTLAFEQSYFFTPVVAIITATDTTTTTTTTPTASTTTIAATTETTNTTETTDTTAVSTATSEAVTKPSTPPPAVTHAQSKGKHSAAPAENCVSYALLCVTAILTWELAH